MHWDTISKVITSVPTHLPEKKFKIIVPNPEIHKSFPSTEQFSTLFGPNWMSTRCKPPTRYLLKSKRESDTNTQWRIFSRIRGVSLSFKIGFSRIYYKMKNVTKLLRDVAPIKLYRQFAIILSQQNRYPYFYGALLCRRCHEGIYYYLQNIVITNVPSHIYIKVLITCAVLVKQQK